MWLILGLASGFFQALGSAVSKRALKDINHYLVAFAYVALSLPFLLLALWKLDLTTTNFTFWWATIASAVFSVGALVIFMKALSIGELSRAVSFLSFTPVFLILTSKIMLGEFPDSLGILGIFLIVTGAYFLERRDKGEILAPFKNLAKDKVALLVLLVAFIYAISSNINKIAVQSANPITYLIWVQLISVLLFIPLIYFRSNQKFGQIKNKLNYLLPIGLLTALTLLCQMTALTLTIVPYVISLKRTSVLFSVILGWIAFKERGIKPKLFGAILMVVGVFFISIS
jgi:drug/metabolite transporter (DMT)-like permease